MSTYSLKYGKGAVPFRPPENWQTTVIHHKEPRPVPLEDALLNSLENPISERPFADWIGRFKNILIVVPDVTRYAGMERVLPALLERFPKGIDAQIVFALGNHRKQTEEEKKGIISQVVYEKVPSFDHDCYDNNQLTPAGRTSSGLEVRLNSALFRADAAIVTGSINFHYLAGFGGGRKSIFPGIAGYDTILGIHRQVFKKDRPGKHESARSGVLRGNPMHEEIMEGIALIRTPLFLINTVLDDRKNLLNVFAGDIKSAHEAGCAWYKEHFEAVIKEKADVVIVSSGGFPKDINFIQSHKAIEHAMGAVKDNGVVIVAGKCEDGLGNADFLGWFEHGLSADMEPHVRKADKVYAQTAYATRCKAERCSIFLVSDLHDESVKKIGLIPKKSIEDAIGTANDGKRKVCYIIPDGSNTLITEYAKQQYE
jgi:nickel-dependent lactate racemase